MKRFISFVLTAFMLFGAIAALPASAYDIGWVWEPSSWDYYSVDTYTLGDVNGDGSINAIDALVIREYMVDETTEIDEQAADILDVGKINAKDLLILRKSFVDLADLADYDNGSVVQNLTVAGTPIEEFSIVVPEGSTVDDNAGNAAGHLRRMLLYMTGHRPVVDVVPTTEHYIEFHQLDENTPEGEIYEIENYKYEVVDGNLHIYGTRRGCLYAIWDILTEYFGMRFYSNDYAYAYESRGTDIPEGTSVFKHPGLDFRHCSQTFGGDDAPYHYFAMHLNGTQINGYGEDKWGTKTGPIFANAHSYGMYWQMATGYENWNTADLDNPGLYDAKMKSGEVQDEYKWNPCFTNDTDYNILFRGLLEVARIKLTYTPYDPKVNSFSFSICDNGYFCTCTKCRLISSDEYFPKRDEYGQGAGGAGLNIYLANRACRDIVEYYDGRAASWEETGEDGGWGLPIEDEYPGVSLYTIIYDHTLPTTILPEENLIIMFCGTACNNHYVGTKGCNGNKNWLGGDGDYDVDSLKAWGQVCKETGAELWYWYYPVTYCSYICDAPNITNIYHDIKFLVEECNVNGVFYEGGGPGYQFEPLKAHMAAQVMWSIEEQADGSITMMSEEEFHEEMKEYLFLFYGDGYEKIYEYMMMYEAAGDALDYEEGLETPCYINNHDRPGDMFSFSYMQENYLTMRGLLEEARALTEAGDREREREMLRRIDYLLVGCDTLGLSANKDWYNNGEAGEEGYDTYVANYTWLYNFIKSAGMTLWSNDVYVLPSELDLDVSPLRAFHDDPSWNVTPWETVD